MSSLTSTIGDTRNSSSLRFVSTSASLQNVHDDRSCACHSLRIDEKSNNSQCCRRCVSYRQCEGDMVSLGVQSSPLAETESDNRVSVALRCQNLDMPHGDRRSSLPRPVGQSDGTFRDVGGTMFDEEEYLAAVSGRGKLSDALFLTRHPFKSVHRFCVHTMEDYKSCPRCRRVCVREYTKSDAVLCAWCYFEDPGNGSCWFCWRCGIATGAVDEYDGHYRLWDCMASRV